MWNSGQTNYNKNINVLNFNMEIEKSTNSIEENYCLPWKESKDLNSENISS